MRDGPTILTCAVTGNHTTRTDHAALPVTPEEIADASLAAADAGAAVVHIHVRDPATGAPSMAAEYYADVVDRIARSGSGVIVNLTTGPGGRFVPGDVDPTIAGAGTTLLPPQRRVEHIRALRPEVCTLDLNTMGSFGSVVVNTPSMVREMARVIHASGTLPELELFDTGDVVLASDLLSEGTLRAPLVAQFVLGVRYAAPASLPLLAQLVGMLPAGSVWGAFGVGRMSFPILASSVLLGGHVRVGLEDNVYLARGCPAPDNAALVKKGRRMVEDLGGRLATPDEARSILGLAAREPARRRAA